MAKIFKGAEQQTDYSDPLLIHMLIYVDTTDNRKSPLMIV